MSSSGNISNRTHSFLGRLLNVIVGTAEREDFKGKHIDLSATRGVGIRIDGISKSFGEHHVLKDLSLEIFPGETFSIIGPSGSGKSLLLKMLIGLEMPDSGGISIDNQMVATAAHQSGSVSYRSSMVFQSSALFNSLSVGENVGLWLREKRVCPEEMVREIIVEKLAIVGLEGTAPMKTSELSGGMKKRVAIARSLAMNPDLILYDEPTAELDPISADELANTILRVKAVTRNTTVIVTHDLNFALHLSDRIAMIHDGRIIQVGTPKEIKESSDPIVRGFVYTTTKGIREE